MVKLDLGCGPNPKEGFEGVDQYSFDGKVKHVLDLREPASWQRWEDGSVEEIFSSHFVEHLTAPQRCLLFNECWRMLVPGGKMTMIVPHWGSSRAYGDPTHQWPPIGEMFLFYLKRDWREANAPHTDKKIWAPGYSCDFEAQWGYALNPALETRSADYKQYAVENHKEAVFDLHATLTKL